MRKVRADKCVFLVLAALALNATAAEYIWDSGGGASDLRFNYAPNWIGDNGYPSTTSDDAVFSYTPYGWAAWLVDEEIRDLTVESSVDFTVEDSAATLEVRNFIIAAPGNADLELTIGGGAEIAIVP